MSLVCRVKIDGLFAKGIIRGTNYQLHYFGDIEHEPCVYCGQPSDSWEHIVPRSTGKKAECYYSRARACQKCNGDRRSKPLLIYLLERKKGALSDISNRL